VGFAAGVSQPANSNRPLRLISPANGSPRELPKKPAGELRRPSFRRLAALLDIGILAGSLEGAVGLFVGPRSTSCAAAVDRCRPAGFAARPGVRSTWRSLRAFASVGLGSGRLEIAISLRPDPASFFFASSANPASFSSNAFLRGGGSDAGISGTMSRRAVLFLRAGERNSSCWRRCTYEA